MLIMLRKGVTLQQGTFTAVIAPEPVILSALNDNPDLGRFLFLFLCGNYSRILSRINRTSSNFEIRRPFTADQLLTALKEAGHTVIFIEHDPTLFDGADRLLALRVKAYSHTWSHTCASVWACARTRAQTSTRAGVSLARQAPISMHEGPDGPAERSARAPEQNVHLKVHVDRHAQARPWTTTR